MIFIVAVVVTYSLAVFVVTYSVAVFVVTYSLAGVCGDLQFSRCLW